MDWTKIAEQGVSVLVVSFFLWFVLRPLVAGHLRMVDAVIQTQEKIVLELRRLRRPKHKEQADAVGEVRM